MAQHADLVVKNGKIVSSQGIFEGGVAIKDGKFVAIGRDDSLPDARRVVDAKGNHILPGLIDPEVHLGIHRPITDDLVSETKAAASTGVTTWGMQLTSPNMQMRHKLENAPEDIVSFKDVFPAFKEAGERHSRVDFFLTPILANDAQSEEIPEYVEKLGVTSFKYYLQKILVPGMIARRDLLKRPTCANLPILPSFSTVLSISSTAPAMRPWMR